MSRTKRLPKTIVAEPGRRITTPRARHLLKKFGITEEQYDHLYQKQAGCCAVCGRAAKDFRYRLAVDHDHVSGEIRGLLCIRCNRYIIGRHRKERGSELLRRGFLYLDADYTGWVVPPKIRRKKRGRKTNRTR